MQMRTTGIRQVLASGWIHAACLLGAAAGTGCVLGGCEAKVSSETYAQLQPGMTLQDVEKIMGGKGERQEVSGMSISAAGIGSSGGSAQEVWVWKSNRSEISVMMGSGKVVSFSKAGF
ncbi:MAG: hypothetical protein NTV94_06805 [Planctomycetota bacterium]|nr:hypothetical protein [Planctomycetota bacterium]